MSVATDTLSLTQKLIGKLQAELQKNAEAYANTRVSQGVSKKPNQLMSPVGFTDHALRLTTTYYAPRPGEYRVFPNKQLRPWRYIAIHLGDTGFDRQYFKSHAGATEVPGDDNGHNEERWMQILKWYVLPRETHSSRDRYSAHYLINRKGEVVVSVDLNDIAYHMPKQFPKLFSDQDNNYYTVGIILEPCYVKKAEKWDSKPNDTNISILEPSQRQHAALAVLLKKLTTVKPIEMVILRRLSKTTLKQQVSQNPTGIIPTFGMGMGTTATDRFIWPVPPPFQKPPPTKGTSFGASREKAPRPHMHQGVDLGEGKAGTPVFAAADGNIYVSKVALGPQQQYKPGSTAYGGPAFVWIRHPGGWDTHYHHLDETNLPYYIGSLPRGFTLPPSSKIVPNGSTIPVSAGQIIGYVAKLKQWPHLHFEIRKQSTSSTAEERKRGGTPLDPMTMLGGENPLPEEQWLRLFAYVDKIRKFNLSTDIFIEKLQDPDFSEVIKLGLQIKKGTLGQSMAALMAYHRVQGLKRATDMQTHSRSTLAKQGVNNAVSLSTAASKVIASVSAVLNRSSASNVVECDPGVWAYDFATGTWADGKAV